MANPDQAKVEFIKQNYPNFEKLNVFDFKTIRDISYTMQKLGYYGKYSCTEMLEESVRNVILKAQGKKKVYANARYKGHIVNRESL